MDETTLLPDLTIGIKDVSNVTLPTSLPEEKGQIRVNVTNQGDGFVQGPLDFNIYASTDSELDFPLNQGRLAGTDELLGNLNESNVDLAPGESTTFTFDFADSNLRVPSVVSPGSYNLFAEIDPATTIVESNEENNLAGVHYSADDSDVVLDWNAATLNAIEADGSLSPVQAARNLAVVHAAVYDAVNAIDRSYTPYRVEVDPSDVADASPEAAAAAAAHQVLVDLFPEQRESFDRQLSRSLAEIPDGESKSQGIELGEDVAEQILAWRSTDGSTEAQGAYTPGNEPGDWRPTPPNFTPAVLPQWGRVTPFAIRSPLDYRTDGPPELTSDQYAAEFDEIKELGELNSTTRTPDQTEIAKFWSFDRPDSFSVSGFWNKIAQEVSLEQGNTLAENARLFAQLNFAQNDAAGIVALDSKFTFNFWRPETAVREADTDGNPNTVADADWTPLIPSPPNPDYLGGHALGGGAAAAVMTSVFGEDFSFTTTSPELPGISRSYDSFYQAGLEDSESRIYGGIHMRAASDDAFAIGQEIGDYTTDTLLV
jgi:hypothetical protein